MHDRPCTKAIRVLAIPGLAAVFAISTLAAFKNMAIVAAASSKLSDVPLADLVKYCKGASRTWPDGKNFTIVIKNPEAPEMHGVLPKLFGGTPAEAKAVISKLNSGLRRRWCAHRAQRRVSEKHHGHSERSP